MQAVEGYGLLGYLERSPCVAASESHTANVLEQVKPGAKAAARAPLRCSPSVQQQPGITIPELAANMGITHNYLYRVLPGLEQERKVEKKGRGWYRKG